MKSVATFLLRSFLKRDFSASDSEKKKIVNVKTHVDGMWGGRRRCDVFNDPQEKEGVVLGGGETHVSWDICDEVIPVMGRSPQAV